MLCLFPQGTPNKASVPQQGISAKQMLAQGLLRQYILPLASTVDADADQEPVCDALFAPTSLVGPDARQIMDCTYCRRFLRLRVGIRLYLKWVCICVFTCIAFTLHVARHCVYCSFSKALYLLFMRLLLKACSSTVLRTPVPCNCIGHECQAACTAPLHAPRHAHDHRKGEGHRDGLIRSDQNAKEALQSLRYALRMLYRASNTLLGCSTEPQIHSKDALQSLKYALRMLYRASNTL